VRQIAHDSPQTSFAAVKPLTTTCLISNYNYAHFLGEAIEGALRQTVPFNEIIVVDDGSTDNSVEMLKSRYGDHPAIRIVAKAHGGQLSCFNDGIARATSDIVFFLDADDVYEPQYVECALREYQDHPLCDFLFCGRRLFGLQNKELLPYPNDADFGYSLLRTAYERVWIGAETSCLSIRRPTLNKIFPLPFDDEWRVRADDCLVFGASYANARKRYLAKSLIKYRVHGNNCFYGRPVDTSATYSRRVAINRLFEYLERKLCLNIERLADSHHREFCTIESPSLSQLAAYFRVGMKAKVSPLQRLTCLFEMSRHYLQAWKRIDTVVPNCQSISPKVWTEATATNLHQKNAA
jgi:glycosyltransferase involved in cell wall biosynthesis